MKKIWCVLFVLLTACNGGSRVVNNSAANSPLTEAKTVASTRARIAQDAVNADPECLPQANMSSTPSAPPLSPLLGDPPPVVSTLKPAAGNSAAYDQPIRFVTSTGKPVKSLKVAVVLPSGVRCIFETDSHGMIPWVNPDPEKAPELHLVWDELIVPPGSDNYEASRNK